MEIMNEGKDSIGATALKDGARRMQKYFEGQGIRVKHAQALEAITTSLGLANWRTLQAKLNVSREPVCEASFGLEAQIIELFQKLMTDFNGPSPCKEGLLLMSTCIAKVCELARQRIGVPPQKDIDASDTYDGQIRALEFWTEVCCPEEKPDRLMVSYQEHLTSLMRNPQFDVSSVNDGETDLPLFTDYRGVQDYLDPAEALEILLTLAQKSLDMTDTEGSQDSGVFQVLQTKVFLSYCRAKVTALFYGLEV